MTTTKTETADQLDIVERLTILLSCIDKDDEEMRGAWETVEDATDEIERSREECNLLRKHCDRMASLAIDNAKDTERAMLYRELLQKWLGNCFVDVYGHGVTFGMGVRKVWAETRSALKEYEEWTEK